MSPDSAHQPPFRHFTMFKFRSMRPDAEKLAAAGARVRGRSARSARRALPASGHGSTNCTVHQRAPRPDEHRRPTPERPELAEQLAMAIPYFEERMRDVEPGITGLAREFFLGYTGKPLPDSVLAMFEADLHESVQNRGRRGRARRSHAHEAALRPRLQRGHGVRGAPLLELTIICKTPLVMLGAQGT